MSDWVSPATTYLWSNGLAVIPLILMTAAATRWLPCRPATKHLLWAMVLTWLVMPPLLPSYSGPPADLAVASVAAAEAAPTVDAASAAGHADRAEPAYSRPQFSDLEPPRITRSLGPAAGRTALSPEQPPKGARERVRRSHATTRETTRGDRPGPSPASRSVVRAVPGLPRRLARVPGSAGPLTSERPSRVRRESPSVDRRAPLILPSSANFNPTDLVYAPKPLDVPPEASADSRWASSQSLIGDGTAGMRHKSKALWRAPEGMHRREPTPSTRPAQRVAAGPGNASAVWPAKKPNDRIPAPPVADFGTAVPNDAQGAAPAISPWTVWATGLLAVRDAVASLPPLPTNIWAGVALVLVALTGIRFLAMRRLIQRGRPAPASVVATVAEVAREFRVRHRPMVLMVDARVSPMIACGVRPCLLLPYALWSQLDEVGRRAVIVHELAHLRRRDHWLSLAETAIGVVYWWHPLVWWVRSRLRAEAETCCDAWVTHVYPRRRRAYAEALLKTRQYIGHGALLMPVPGIGVVSGRAERFARRLKMVMTQSTKPRTTLPGIALVLSLAATGWLASPARSCDKDKAKAKAAACDKAVVAVAAGIECKDCPECKACKTTGDCKKCEECAKRTKDGRSTIVVGAPAVAGHVGVGHAQLVGHEDDDEDEANEEAEERAEELAEELEELREELEELARELRGLRPDEGAHGLRGYLRAPEPPRAPRAPRPPREPREPRAPRPPRPDAHRAPAPLGHGWRSLGEGEKIWKTYRLSEGKLEDFTKLMSRSDVPILVRPKSDAIDIQATERQHQVLYHFFQMIDPSDERAEVTSGDAWFGSLPERLADAFSSAHADCDGNCEKCRASARYREELERARHHAREALDRVRVQMRGEAEHVRARARAQAEHIRQELREHARRARVNVQVNEELIQQLVDQANAMREQAESFRDRGDEYRQQADELREKIRQILEKAMEAPGNDHNRSKIERRGEELRASAEMLAQQSEQMVAQAGELEQQAERLEKNAQRMEEQVEEMQAHADNLDDRASAVDDASRSLYDMIDSSPELAMSLLMAAEQVGPDLIVQGEDQPLQNTSEFLQQMLQKVEPAPIEAVENLELLELLRTGETPSPAGEKPESEK